MKKILSILLGLAFLLSMTGVAAFAATSSVSGIIGPNRVWITASQPWVRVDRSIQLYEVIKPDGYDYDAIEWYTLDYDLVSVDDNGEVTGLKAGIATIAMYVYVDGPTRRVQVGSAEIEIEVRSTIATSFSINENNLDPDVPRVSTVPSATKKKSVIPTKTVNDAVKKALVKGTTTNTTFKNYTSISTVSLESAATDMKLGGGVVLLNFDTYALDGKTVEARLTINPRAYKPVKYNDPLQVGHSINVRVNTNGADIVKARDKFEKFYKNDMMIIKAGQQDGYGMNVTYTIKASDALAKAKPSNLRLYSYDPDKGNSGMFKLIKNANLSIGGDKKLHFTTDTGNYFIISNGEFVKK